MCEIKIVKKASQTDLEEQNVTSWPVWTKETSEFPWKYEQTETCYFLEGEVVVTPKGGRPVEIEKGDLVTFPKGMECSWVIRKPVRKHYTFED